MTLWIIIAVVNQLLWFNALRQQHSYRNYWHGKYQAVAMASALRRIDASQEPNGTFVGCLERHCSCVK